MEEQREAASRRVAEADERIGELTANFEALGLRDTWRSAELATLTVELARERDEHFSIMAELTAKLTAEQGLAGRNWDDRCRFHAELLEATVRGEQVAKELIAAQQQLAQLDSALRQRQEETEQTHKALGEAEIREAELSKAIAAGADREEALTAKLALSDDCVLRLSAQRYAALADARSARSQVGQLAIHLRQAQDEAQSQLGELQDHLGAAQAEAQVANAKTIVVERIASERSEEIARLNATLSRRDSQTAELELVLVRMRSDLNKHLVEKSELVEKLAERQLDVEKHQATAEWLRQVHAALGSPPSWWQLLPSSWRRRREHRRLLRRGLFDEQKYIARYPDVAAAGMDPLRHYIMHGLPEGRQI